MVIKKQSGDNPEADNYASGEQGDAPMDTPGETADIPSTILEGQSVEPGDVIQLKVVSKDDNAGTITVAYDHGSDSGEPGEGGIAEAAKQFEA